ncbi:hypothetical protein BRADI_1g59695v3 [Brachypodium distachyon]|uniref:Uncharacterized protein n=1 Tax=Brachypodium distachyon TaxID=15368 RepID=A0A2K2DSG9_BRADI|nr:hypothetical protein BRADI_1g59695v3 [Brachypodium distachyon]
MAPPNNRAMAPPYHYHGSQQQAARVRTGMNGVALDRRPSRFAWMNELLHQLTRGYGLIFFFQRRRSLAALHFPSPVLY